MNSSDNDKISMLIVARDLYPPFRVDMTILFSKYLKNYLKIDWLMRNEKSEPSLRAYTDDETYYVIGRDGIRGKIDAVVQNVNALWRITRKDYDIVQCRDTFLIASLYAVVARFCGVPFVYWMSYPMEEGYLHRSRQAFADKLYMKAIIRWLIGKAGTLSLYRVALPLARHVFVQSDQMKNDVSAEGVAAAKISAVPMGVDIQAFSNGHFSSVIEPCFPGMNVILYLGTLDIARRLDIPASGVAKVLRVRKDTIFVLIGRSSQAEKDFVSKELKDISERIFFLDQMPLAEALGYVRRADVCLAPYPVSPKMLASATPTKLVEYLAMGRRVVANHHPDQSHVISGAGLGILTEYSPEGFYTAISQSLDLGEPSAEDVERAVEWLRTNRDYAMLSDTVAAQYSAIIEPPGSKQP